VKTRPTADRLEIGHYTTFHCCRKAPDSLPFGRVPTAMSATNGLSVDDFFWLPACSCTHADRRLGHFVAVASSSLS